MTAPNSELPTELTGRNLSLCSKSLVVRAIPTPPPTHTPTPTWAGICSDPRILSRSWALEATSEECYQSTTVITGSSAASLCLAPGIWQIFPLHIGHWRVWEIRFSPSTQVTGGSGRCKSSSNFLNIPGAHLIPGLCPRVLSRQTLHFYILQVSLGSKCYFLPLRKSPCYVRWKDKGLLDLMSSFKACKIVRWEWNRILKKKILALRAWRKCATHRKRKCIYSAALTLLLVCVVVTASALTFSYLA